MAVVQPEDAFEFLVTYLAQIPNTIGQRSQPEQRPYGGEVWLPTIAAKFWASRNVVVGDLSHSDAEPYVVPFYDAAWELCRIGVLRPGQFAPLGRSISGDFKGDGYSITTFGRNWIKKAERPLTPTDPSRFAQVIAPFRKHFGEGFEQRALEAVGCYRTANYLSCCVMAGAAAESILLATAVARIGSEEEVLKDYRGASGRRKVSNSVLQGLKPGVTAPFQIGMDLLSFWRDEAAHGVRSNITEIEAYTSLGRLLRFAQSTADDWDALTGAAGGT
jgi:hypothetical protein